MTHGDHELTEHSFRLCQQLLRIDTTNPPGNELPAAELLAEEPFMTGLEGLPPDEIYDAGVRRGADNLKFIVEELKPFIDTTFSVYTNRENTYVAGSSYGGLISLYSICEYPDIFSNNLLCKIFFFSDS